MESSVQENDHDEIDRRTHSARQKLRALLADLTQQADGLNSMVANKDHASEPWALGGMGRASRSAVMDWAENRLADFDLWVIGIGALSRPEASLDRRLASYHERHVLTQTFSLIDALVLCHEQFYDPEQGHVILAHNDLKPENILVFDNDAESLVGTWKIADFGLSKIKQVVEDSTFLSPDDRISHDLSLSKAIRPPGGYTAPEIIKFFRIDNRTSSQHRLEAHGTLVLGETDHFRRVLLGINDAVVLIYSNCLQISTLQDDLQDIPTNWKTVHLKSDTEYFFQPSISLNGHRLVVCSRDNKVSQVENWHYIDLSVPREALEDLVLPNAMPPPDLQGSTSPAFMVPLQNTVGTYYSTACAAATGSGHDFPESQYLVYVTQNQRLVMPKTEIWSVELQRYGAGGRVKSTSPNRLLALSGKLKQPSLGFNWSSSIVSNYIASYFSEYPIVAPDFV
ncbi:unnamed protein product [Aureobasidium pullulans]|nr:unnamed protein product [Aureobasidium pullulans]